jgi:hypothetical protein
MTDTPRRELTLEAMQAEPWDAALSLPLPEQPTLEYLEEVREGMIVFLDWASNELARIAGPDQIRDTITRAAERLTEIALERAAAILGERLQRGFSDAALDQHDARAM